MARRKKSDTYLTIRVEDGNNQTEIDLTESEYQQLKTKRWVKVAYQYGKYCLIRVDEAGVCSTNTVLP